jgi:hypothetical protein
MTNTKKQHYIPQVYMRNFAISDDPNKVWYMERGWTHAEPRNTRSYFKNP